MSSFEPKIQCLFHPYYECTADTRANHSIQARSSRMYAFAFKEADYVTDQSRTEGGGGGGEVTPAHLTIQFPLLRITTIVIAILVTEALVILLRPS